MVPSGEAASRQPDEAMARSRPQGAFPLSAVPRGVPSEDEAWLGGQGNPWFMAGGLGGVATSRSLA